jgi:chromosome segregation ATPase
MTFLQKLKWRIRVWFKPDENLSKSPEGRAAALEQLRDAQEQLAKVKAGQQDISDFYKGLANTYRGNLKEIEELQKQARAQGEQFRNLGQGLKGDLKTLAEREQMLADRDRMLAQKDQLLANRQQRYKQLISDNQNWEKRMDGLNKNSPTYNQDKEALLQERMLMEKRLTELEQESANSKPTPPSSNNA